MVFNEEVSEQLEKEEEKEKASSRLLSAKINLFLFAIVIVLGAILAYEIIGHMV